MGEYSVRRMSFSRMNFENLFMKADNDCPNSKFDFARIETERSHLPLICPTHTEVLSFVQWSVIFCSSAGEVFWNLK